MLLGGRGDKNGDDCRPAWRRERLRQPVGLTPRQQPTKRAEGDHDHETIPRARSGVARFTDGVRNTPGTASPNRSGAPRSVGARNRSPHQRHASCASSPAPRDAQLSFGPIRLERLANEQLIAIETSSEAALWRSVIEASKRPSCPASPPSSASAGRRPRKRPAHGHPRRPHRPGGRGGALARRTPARNQLRAELERFWPGPIGLFSALDSPISLAFLCGCSAQGAAGLTGCATRGQTHIRGLVPQDRVSS